MCDCTASLLMTLVCVLQPEALELAEDTETIVIDGDNDEVCNAHPLVSYLLSKPVCVADVIVSFRHLLT